MDVDLNDIDDKLKQIKPNELDYLQHATLDAKSAEGTIHLRTTTARAPLIFPRYLVLLDDIAIAEAINQIEAELNEDESAHRTSIFDAEGVDVDMNEIDASLQQIAPEERDFDNQSKYEKVSAEG